MLRNVKIDLLRQVALFKGCSKRELGEIARIADEIDFPAGKTLITQGEPGKQCFVLIEGSEQPGEPDVEKPYGLEPVYERLRSVHRRSNGL